MAEFYYFCWYYIHNMRFIIALVSVLFLIAVPARTQPNQIDHWEMIVNASNTWHYFPGTEEPPSTWRDILFDDSSWLQGPGGIGYGDDDDATVIDPVGSFYMRQGFQISDPSLLVGALFYIDYDDAFVAYLNGVEISRGNIGVPGQIPPYTMYADDDTHEAQLYQGGEPEHFAIGPVFLDSLLVAGDNVLAIQVHNANATSSDLSSIPFLFVATMDTTGNGTLLPPWFDENDFGFFTHLPIMSINTNGQEILNDPRILANLKVYDNDIGAMNSLFDPPNGYDGNISIEIRGNSSQMFEKKSYAFETQLDNGENNNVELLGLPTENDWILYGPYSDKTLLRNALVMQLAREMGWYASRTEFCELFINDEYRGLYILMEKIKQDINRVDIDTMDDDDNFGDSLTGGYIVKLDWPDNGSTYDWHSPVTNYNGTYLNLNYQYDYPDREDITFSQEAYIENYVSSFELALIGNDFMNIQHGYRKYIDVHSFIDNFILNEVPNNIDGYRLSNFFTKVRNSKGGKLFAGPVWDFNLGFGNADYGNGWYTSGWALNNPFVTDVIPFHLKRLQEDPAFANLLHCRWNELRTTTLSNDHIYTIIDSISTYLGPALERNFERWDILGQYVWPNYFIGDTYEEEIDYLKGFIQNRMNWIDNNLPGTGTSSQSFYMNKLVVSEINYQASTDFDSGDWLELFNNSTATIYLSGWQLKDENNLNTYSFPYGTFINPGQYLVVCSNVAKFNSTYPGIGYVLGPFNWKLGQNDQIRIYDADNFTVCEIEYKKNNPWPTLGEDLGETLELIDPDGDLNDPNNWLVGCSGGSPGSPYVFPCPNVMVQTVRDESISIYPNPVLDVLNISFEAPYQGNLEIITGSGKIVKKASFNGSLVQMFVEELKTGYYILKITSDNKNWVRPLVIK